MNNSSFVRVGFLQFKNSADFYWIDEDLPVYISKSSITRVRIGKNLARIMTNNKGEFEAGEIFVVEFRTSDGKDYLLHKREIEYIASFLDEDDMRQKILNGPLYSGSSTLMMNERINKFLETKNTLLNY